MYSIKHFDAFSLCCHVQPVSVFQGISLVLTKSEINVTENLRLTEHKNEQVTRLQATSCANFGSEVMKNKQSVRGTVNTLGSIYAITTKQNINITMFGFVKKKQTCISKTHHAQFKAPPKTIQV